MTFGKAPGLRQGLAVLLMSTVVFGQGQSARTAAPVDLTGYWVSVVTEDWRYRMVTPKKGDYPSIPLNAEGRKAADSWDGRENRCEAFGAGNIMRQPGRIHITWDGDTSLKVETDAGTQTRVFRFGGQAGAGAGTLQGESRAAWEFGGGRAKNATGGSLKVVTTKMGAGFLQGNGVPYSANAVITEYFHRTNESNGDSWLVVTTLVEDPFYLTGPFQRSTHFKRQADAAGWKPTACVQ